MWSNYVIYEGFTEYNYSFLVKCYFLFAVKPKWGKLRETCNFLKEIWKQFLTYYSTGRLPSLAGGHLQNYECCWLVVANKIIHFNRSHHYFLSECKPYSFIQKCTKFTKRQLFEWVIDTKRNVLCSALQNWTIKKTKGLFGKKVALTLPFFQGCTFLGAC